MNARSWITAGAMAVAILASSGRAGLAQDRDYRNRSRDNYGRDRWDHGRFNDHDRQATRGWYNEHRMRPPLGLRRQDRLPPFLESRLRVGGLLAPPLRSRIYAVPSDLLFRLPPAPRGYRYVLIGGHVVLIDPAYRVHDMIWLELW
jgi:Ni/Co efflux regulator RcnB